MPELKERYHYTLEELDELKDLIANDVAHDFPFQYSERGDYGREVEETLRMHMLNGTTIEELREHMRIRHEQWLADAPAREAQYEREKARNKADEEARQETRRRVERTPESSMVDSIIRLVGVTDMSWQIVHRFVEDEEDSDRIKVQIDACVDIDALRYFNYGWLEVLGKLALDDFKGRSIIGRRMSHADARIEALQTQKGIGHGDTPEEPTGVPEPPGNGRSPM